VKAMTINRNNFEAYLLDYLEGNLEPLLTADLMVFLTENPEYEKYIPEYDRHALTADENKFKEKYRLKKDFTDIHSLNAANFDEFCIAASEGILSSQDTERMNAYISDDRERQKVFETYKKLKLDADPAIRFPGKSVLKKQVRGVNNLRYLYLGLSVAALLAVVFLLMRPQSSPVVPEVNIISEITDQNTVKNTPVEEEPSGEALSHSGEMKITLPPVQVEKPKDSILPELAQTERIPVILPSLRPVEGTLTTDFYAADIRSEIEVKIASLEHQEVEELKDSGENTYGFLMALIDKVNFWKTAETAVSGINYLTESKIAIGKTTDENGNLTGLLLSTESYSISGNIAK